MQHFLAGVEVVFARWVREGGQAAQGGTARAGLYQLGPVHRHVVLPGGTGAFLARDLWGTCVLRRHLLRPGPKRRCVSRLRVRLCPTFSMWECCQTPNLDGNEEQWWCSISVWAEGGMDRNSFWDSSKVSCKRTVMPLSSMACFQELRALSRRTILFGVEGDQPRVLPLPAT